MYNTSIESQRVDKPGEGKEKISKDRDQGHCVQTLQKKMAVPAKATEKVYFAGGKPGECGISKTNNKNGVPRRK